MISEGESRKGVSKRNKASIDAKGKIKAGRRQDKLGMKNQCQRHYTDEDNAVNSIPDNPS